MHPRVPAGPPYDTLFGYCRAVRVGDRILVAGTAALDAEGNVVSPGDAGAQMRFLLRRIIAAVEQLGGSARDVVRTRIYTTDVSQSEAIGLAHGEVFREIQPASALVGVAALIHPDMVVEVEAEAIVMGES
jgi:enamine deaminase RidA (YjgF/YER057c/UK114 family)